MLEAHHDSIRRPWIFIWLGLATFVLVGLILYLGRYWKSERSDFAELLCEPAHLLCDKRREYTLSSGSPGGMFHKLGEEIRSELGPDIAISTSTGSPENARRVAGGSRALGFVENDALRGDEWISKRLVPVAPIYLELLQIALIPQGLQRFASWPTGCEDWEKFATCAPSQCAAHAPLESSPRDVECEAWTPPTLRLFEAKKMGNKAGQCTRHLLEHAAVYAGPDDSGTKLLASYVFSISGIAPDIRPVSTFVAQHEAVASGKVGVAVVFMGQENWSGLPGIRGIELDPELTSILQQTHGARFQAATAKIGDAGLPTIGAFAWLVTSPDVPTPIQKRVLRP